MNIAICDDEKVWQGELLKQLREYSIERNLDFSYTCFSDGKSLYDSEKKFDIIFMDFQMEGSDGIETSRRLRSSNSDSTIIFVSSYTHIAMDAYEVKAYRFLGKPIDKAKLFKALDDYRAEIDTDNFLIYKTHEKTIRIKISEIIYAEACKNHTKIHTANEDFEILKNLKEVQKDLSGDKFFRCHKAYLVSFLHIISHDNTDIMFDDESGAYISRKYLPSFRKAFQEYILKYNTGEL